MMRFTLATIALYAALVLGQENAIAIPNGQSSLDVTAGQATTITWSNPSDGTVTIQLQYSGDDQLAGSGITLATNIQASAGTASFTVPADAVEAGTEYTIRITDDENPQNFNFAPAFTVAGAEGTASLPAGSGSSTATGSRTASDSSSTDDSSSTTDDSASSSTTADSSSTTDDSSSTTESSSRTSRTSSSETAAATTEAPDSSTNGVGALHVQGGLVAAAAAVAAML